MVLLFSSRRRAPFRRRSKTAGGNGIGFRVHRGLIDILLGSSPADSLPEVVEKAIQWFDGAMGEPKGKPQAKSERKDTSDDKTC